MWRRGMDELADQGAIQAANSLSSPQAAKMEAYVVRALVPPRSLSKVIANRQAVWMTWNRNRSAGDDAY